MSRQKRQDTGPELLLRKALFARGMRFLVHQRVGKARPDILFPRAKVAVFVMGDFWHDCPAHGTKPKSNGTWWAEKLKGNRVRDERQRSELEAAGWHVEWVWECDDAGAAADRIREIWRERRNRRG